MWCCMIMKLEYDFEGTWTTIPRVRDAQPQGCNWGALVCVHAGHWPGYLHQRAVRSIPGASRVSLRVSPRMTVRGRRQGERAGQCDCDDDPFIVLTETKFSIRYIPVWARYSPCRASPDIVQAAVISTGAENGASRVTY